MKKIFALIIVLAAFKVNAQNEIKFNQTTTWKETTEKAAATGKLIFVDCYTSWCGPCKWMDKNVFVEPAVATFFNDNFINAKIDMEKGEGVELRKKYEIHFYPSFLFVNNKGEVVHRTGSRMSAEEFLEEGKRAINPKSGLVSLTEKYNAGARDLPFLLDYYLVLRKSDRTNADKIGKDIVGEISVQQLNTEFGWKAIKALARNESDKLGAHFMANQNAYNSWSKQEEREELKGRLITNTLYSMIKENNEQAFMDKLAFFKRSDKADRKKQSIMLEADYYLEHKRLDDYLKVTNAALNNELKNDGEKLSAMAWRAGFNGGPTPAFLEQAYVLGKRAVEIAPEEYGVISSFGYICLYMKNKEEGLKAAKKAYQLADTLGSKVQNRAKQLVGELEAL
ncbi:Thioredoxin-like [Pedobacter sp. ok626]|uniref:thioredoxin family protein n=1 Tax=Pedobacter sp. ok626 TaxID=1761882 RepID=UPI00087ED2DF|nr:thioredoxin family protein [Pedobacter sp. ok626]SDJ91306.1 Thioredoxin-like [Pedobacter sp. ok626]